MPPAVPPSTSTATVDMVAAGLAAADAESFRGEGPRIDARIGTLLSLVLGGLASSGAVGGIGGSVSRTRHAYLAMSLLALASVVIVVGLVLVVRLILPRMTRRVTVHSWSLAHVADLPDTTAARVYYRAAARDCLAYQACQARSHAVAIRRRFRRFRRAGWVLLVGVVLAAVGFLALGWGW